MMPDLPFDARPHGVASRRRPRRLWLVLFLAFALLPFLGGCEGAARDFGRIPPALDDGWPVAAAGSVGFDGAALDTLARSIAEGEHGRIDALLIARDGKLVFERYFRGYGRDSLHTLQSVTKSVASTLVGIVLQREAIKGVNQSIQEFFPADSQYFAESQIKQQITLHHMLTMTAGFEWPEHDVAYGHEDNMIRKLADAYDWPTFVLKQPMAEEPGVVFNYSTGVSTLLGTLVRNVTGTPTDTFAQQYLFDPLGISNVHWFRNTEHPDRWVHTGGGLHLTPRSLAKIGYLFLSGGRWQGTQILSPEWIEAATTPWVRTNRAHPVFYGYQWWLRPLEKNGSGIRSNDIIHAWGWGGQHVFAIPDLDLLVVFTGSNFTNAEMERRPIALLYDQVLPALKESS